jgi:2-amino-4-hydroxy-6-hydroxymethyldihydropteridine diphosphokinase
MNNVYLLMGGNMGDRPQNMHQAQQSIGETVGAVIISSSLYETAAWGLTDQPSFLNQVLQVSTELTAHQVLDEVLLIEKKMGRKRTQKMGPRTIDIDILFYNDETVTAPHLNIPHPEIANRRFVLAPLNEIASSFVHPVLKKTVADLLLHCTDNLEVRLYHQQAS